MGVSGGFGLRILNSTLSYGMSTLELDFGFISNYSLSPSLSFGLVWALCHWKSCWNTGKGNYTCAPPGAQPADVTVHVLNGKSFQVNSPPTCRLTLSLSADWLKTPRYLLMVSSCVSLVSGGMNPVGVGFFCRWASGRHAAREQESINQRRRKSGPFGCQMPLGRSSDCITVFHPALAIREPVSHRLIIF